MVEILDEVRKEFVKDLIANGKRPSGRAFDEFRPATVEQNVIPNAEGSARVHLGKTQVLAGVKLGIGEPFADKPDEGMLSTNAELLQLAHPTFESGPPDARSVELARVVDRGIRSSSAVDLKALFIEEGKAWNFFLDLYILDHDGNLIDAAALAAMSAILCAKQPRLEDGKVVREGSLGLVKSGATCVATTFGKIGSTIVADPDLDEEKAMDARLTITTTPDRVCSIQKGCAGGFTRDEVASLIDLAFEKGKGLRALL
ncbi:MAG: exosome complex protein Rrp42 [Candidatus ainarchaeum sp.]|nr:exosome complex protein Rrp42 [Candidatus ainarchaeum sp.]